jgi:sigma-B regulation protein RsbU (phosphoserine phosphatase)
VVGGDFYRVERLDANRYALLMADVMGHGVASALYTMQLSSLWEDHRAELEAPARFVGVLNQRLHALVREAGYFATGVFVLYNAATGQVRSVRAGHAAPLLFRAGGDVEAVGRSRPALGMFADSTYDETLAVTDPGDALLLFTDGAVELLDAAGRELGVEGLKQLVREQTAGACPSGFRLEVMEEQLLRFSNEIHLPDDLTLVKPRRQR